MNGFLLDTDVVSMLAPSAKSSALFLNWLDRADRAGRVFLSVITIVEIEKGIVLLSHKGAHSKAAGLKAWLVGLVAAYDDKILVLDPAAAILAGQAEAKAIAAGYNSGMADALVAGIAQARNLTVITRNVRHFTPFGISVLSPDEAATLSL